jgi:quercetin dioxygenase-like cupin family protein
MDLQARLVQGPQAEVPTDHYFSGGMYCRRMRVARGTVIVGQVHKADHFFLCAGGEFAVWDENGMRVLQPGDVICSKAGTKRVLLALVDAVGINLHKTDKTDLDELEDELVERDPASRYDSGNQVLLVIEGECA